MKKQTKKITSVSIRIPNEFTYTTKLCIQTLINKKSTDKAKLIAIDELLRYAGELDRINNLTSKN